MEGVPIKIMGRATLTSSPFFEKKKKKTAIQHGIFIAK